LIIFSHGLTPTYSVWKPLPGVFSIEEYISIKILLIIGVNIEYIPFLYFDFPKKIHEGADDWLSPIPNAHACVGISHKAVLLREPAKLALFRATTNILSSDCRLANQRED
jgi:hypothetical protein